MSTEPEQEGAAAVPEDERRMPFLEHLGELRDRIRNSIIGMFLAAVVCWFIRMRIFAWLALPLATALEKAEALGIKGKLIYISPMEQFMVLLKTAIVGAVFFGSPVVFYQLWAFIAPGLYRHEKRLALPFIVAAVLLFCGGGLFCYYFVLPAGYEFFMTSGRLSPDELSQLGKVGKLFMSIEPNISMESYYDLTLMLLLVFGVVFELPLVLSVLAMLGVVSAGALWRFNRYAILIFAVLGALLTPGDLVVGQLAMTGSLTVLYNLSILIALVVQRRRKAAEEAEAAASGDGDGDPGDGDPPDSSTALVPRS